MRYVYRLGDTYTMLSSRVGLRIVGGPMVYLGSSSDTGIELTWAGQTFFTPFRTLCVILKGE